jgi:hypothetical protein
MSAKLATGQLIDIFGAVLTNYPTHRLGYCPNRHITSLTVRRSLNHANQNFFRSSPKAGFIKTTRRASKKKSFQGESNLNRATCTHFHDKHYLSIAWFSLIENRLVINSPVKISSPQIT